MKSGKPSKAKHLDLNASNISRDAKGLRWAKCDGCVENGLLLT